MVLVSGLAVFAMMSHSGVPRPVPRSVRCPVGTGAVAHPPGGVTPYLGQAAADQFIQGATLDLSRLDNPNTEVPARLRSMRDQYHVNTITVYGLEHLDSAGRDRLFEALTALGMRIVVRFEAYDQDSFAFTGEDVDRVLGLYSPLLQYVSAPAWRNVVEYFAVNMPIDDLAVQGRLGGVNSDLSKLRQVDYAKAFVSKARAMLERFGLTGANLYLGVFYGWDLSYDTPSYAAAQADGYFLTSYSYPGAAIPNQSASDADLINAPALRRAMDRFASQYANAPPVVVEYGFQTLEYQAGVVPSQTAGLVSDLAAKRKAVAATTRFYCANYPVVRGTMYFGYNVYKTEGTPPALLDFTLDYSLTPRSPGRR
jgi:hypothetical protein